MGIKSFVMKFPFRIKCFFQSWEKNPTFNHSEKSLDFSRSGFHMFSFNHTQESPLGIVVLFASIPWGICRNAHSYSYLINYFPHRLNFIYLYKDFFFFSCCYPFSHLSLFPWFIKWSWRKQQLCWKQQGCWKEIHSCPGFLLKMWSKEKRGCQKKNKQEFCISKMTCFVKTHYCLHIYRRILIQMTSLSGLVSRAFRNATNLLVSP